MADNHIKNILKDVLKHTHGLGIFEMVKITGDLEKTEIQTVANPVPKLTHEEEYRILSTSFSEIQS